MKFNKTSQLFLVSALGLLVATLFSACALLKIDYVYVGTSTGITVFAMDGHTGALRNIVGEQTAGLSSPVALATSADFLHLYVANSGNKTISHQMTNDNGSLSNKDSVTLPGTPISLAVNKALTYLYVVYLNGTTPTLATYPLSSGTIGTLKSATVLSLAGYPSDQLVPTAVAVLPNSNAVYVTAYDQSAYNPGGTATSAANPGWIFGYAVGTDGTLTAASGSPWQAGVKPSALVTDLTNRYIYVTDYASNQLIGYAITSSNVLNYLINGPFRTGAEPVAIAIDPRGKYLYVANKLDSTVTSYAVDLGNGTPTVAATPSGTYNNPTDTTPVAVAVDPALGRVVFTANYYANTASSYMMNTETGALTPAQSTPFTTGKAPTCILGIPHGNHSFQVVNN